MALVRHPNLQNVNGKYFEGATVTAITNRDTETAATAYTSEAGSTPVTYPVTSGSEGELDIWVPVGAYETEFGEDTVDTPAVWEAISGEEIANMLTLDDIAGFPDYVFSPLTYGGDPTGVADSTEALQAAIDAAAAVHGTVHLGNGSAIWKYSSQLSIATPSQAGMRITSSGSGGRSSGTPRLRFTGADAALVGFQPVAFLLDSVQRVEIDHVTFEYNNTGFTGSLVRLNDSTADIINVHIHHCRFQATSGIASLSADALLETRNDLIISTISECGFNGAANNLIRLGHPTAGGNVNEVTIRNCTFNDTDNVDRGQIEIQSGIVQALHIVGCSFEGASPHNITPIRGANQSDGDTRTNLIYAMTVEACWSGDAGGGGPANGFARGLNGIGDFGPVIFIGNYIAAAAPGGASGPLVTAGDNGCGFVFIGNRTAGGVLAGTNGSEDSNFKALYLYNSVGGSEEPTTGNLYAVDDPPIDFSKIGRLSSHFNGPVGISPDSDFDDTSLWDAGTALVLGGRVPSGAHLTVGADRGAVYTKTITGDTAMALVLQTETDDNDAEVQVVAGTTPANKIRASGVGVAFNGTAPIAKPTVTGAKGGNAAVADLVTKLASLGLITDGTS